MRRWLSVCLCSVLMSVTAHAATFWVSGENTYGQLGKGDTNDINVFAPNTNLAHAIRVVNGYYASAALMRDGTVMASGYGGYGELGNGSFSNDSHVFIPVAGVSNVVQLAHGGATVFVRERDGGIFSWGYGGDGELAIGNNYNDTNLPTEVTALFGAKKITFGTDAYHGFAIFADGSVKGWGWNQYGQVGIGSTNNSTNLPTLVSGLAGVKEIANNYYDSYALMADGTVKSCGEGFNYGGTGLGIWADTNVFTTIPGLSNVKRVVCGGYHVLALLNDGTVKGWGYNDNGELGLGTNGVTTDTPTLIPGLSNVVDIIGDEYGTFFILGDRTVLATGDNGDGGFGAGNYDEYDSPTNLPWLNGVSKIFSGGDSTFAAFDLHAAPNDYDGDGKSDLAVYQASAGNWYIQKSSDGSLWQPHWGAGNMTPVPGDYDGDGTTDVAVYDPGAGNWYISRSGDSAFQLANWGFGGVVPVQSDYDGDGITDLAVYDPSTGNWYILKSGDGTLWEQNWGARGYVAVPADYDGDGKTDLAVYNPRTGTWYIQRSSDGALQTQQWGSRSLTPVPGDYDGDGKDDIAVYNARKYTWTILKSSDATLWTQSVGPAPAAAVLGDYDGDGTSDLAAYIQRAGDWTFLLSTDGSSAQNWGWAAAQPVLARP